MAMGTKVQYLGYTTSSLGSDSFTAINPQDGQTIEGLFVDATSEEINKAVVLAEKAFSVYKKTTNETRTAFLEAIASEIENLGDELINTGMQETALPQARLQGERGRTCGQLRFFASIVKEGSYVDARIDTAMPDRAPIPKPDIRQMSIALGPVAVFGASNFPLAFSVAGGDTASALAAGCPVIFKAHPAHPNTSDLVASAIIKAAQNTGMPDGVFSMVHGRANRVGEELVKHPAVKAVGFTGSFRGGKALFDLANQREEPIPVYAEMGSTNPVFILPGALKDAKGLATGMIGSISLGVGQFCTNPGLSFIPQTEDGKAFIDAITEYVTASDGGTMLTQGIKSAYEAGKANLEVQSGVQSLARSKKPPSSAGVEAQIYQVSTKEFSNNPILAREVFGPSSVIVNYKDKEDILTIARNLDGHLTATVHGTPEDFKEYRELFDILEGKVGRILINGFPTGVEVCHSMVHGGPFPATTASQTTSVGGNAIQRFVRPVSYQNFPDDLLPEQLKNRNSLKIMRLIDGELTRA
ncbi:MAG: aldehyde dehydrogenase (NADP(+)) [Bacteroidetes bacterium]|nr:aldehyde dehydrogenase (NADP(+)) [Bacteroidota bacterium]MDA1119753.1 aldehyde dehydrogenase (NADP(+)) [Bacteroidota bacterium]